MSSPCLPGPAAHNPDTGLGVASLDAVVCTLIDRAVAPSTLAAYQSGKRCYLSFCGQFSFSPLPLEERVLCRFVASLVAASLSYQSICSYLSAILHLQITHGLPDPALASFARLAFVLKGVQRAGPPKHPLSPESPPTLATHHFSLGCCCSSLRCGFQLLWPPTPVHCQTPSAPKPHYSSWLKTNKSYDSLFHKWYS